MLNSVYFTALELKCTCCGKLEMSSDFLPLLDVIRAAYDKPMIVTSGYRCKKHNLSVGGVKNSSHTQGLAVDVAVTRPYDRAKLIGILMAVPAITGIGISERFIHIDTKNRPYRAVWLY